MKRISAAAAVLALTAAAGQAQDSLTEETVRGFFAEVGSEAEAAVRAEDWQGIQDWITRHVSDEAPVAVRGTVTMTGGAVASFEVAMTGAQLERFSGMAMGNDRPMIMEMVQDYALATHVQGVNELPGGQASAIVMFHESGRLSPPEDAEHAEMPEIVFDALFTCAIRLSPEAGGPQIVNLACDGISMM